MSGPNCVARRIERGIFSFASFHVLLGLSEPFPQVIDESVMQVKYGITRRHGEIFHMTSYVIMDRGVCCVEPPIDAAIETGVAGVAEKFVQVLGLVQLAGSTCHLKVGQDRFPSRTY